MGNSDLSFQQERNRLVDEMNVLAHKLEKFTNKISPQNWRSTGHTVSMIRQYATQLETVREMSEGEKLNPEIKKMLETA